MGLTENDRTLEYRSFGWNSAQVLSLMPFLETGLTLHIAKRFSHSRFFEWIASYGITFSAGVPTVLNMLLNKPLGYTAKDIPTLRLMTCSTAPLTAQQWQQFEEMYGVHLLQLYGMSEAGWVCGNRHYKRKMGTVGLPALHQEFAIVDSDGKTCPAGVEGEVTVGGPQTAVGYLRDDGTIEPIRGKRIKTGDLAIMDDEGFVRVTGRTKDLIIRGGINIAPLEIDEVLLKHPGILDAAAVGVPDKIYGEEVVCYVVAKEPGLTEASVANTASNICRRRRRPNRSSSCRICRRMTEAKSCATGFARTGRRGRRCRHEPTDMSTRETLVTLAVMVARSAKTIFRRCFCSHLRSARYAMLHHGAASVRAGKRLSFAFQQQTELSNKNWSRGVGNVQANGAGFRGRACRLYDS